MARKFLSALRNILLGEVDNNGDFYSTAPVDVLVAVHGRLLALAAQIRAHAEQAPYSQVAVELRRIAAEKEADADALKKRIESDDAQTRPQRSLSVSGKNHWERMTRDLHDQKLLDDVLQQQEARLAAGESEIAQLIAQLRAHQAPHRKTLTTLVAVADPQATQT